jgi:hypothetical protein
VAFGHLLSVTCVEAADGGAAPKGKRRRRRLSSQMILADKRRMEDNWFSKGLMSVCLSAFEQYFPILGTFGHFGYLWPFGVLFGNFGYFLAIMGTLGHFG